MNSQSVAQKPSSYDILTVREAYARPDFIKIDVRQPEELASDLGYIDGVHNYPLNELLQNGPPAALPKDAPILMICRSGGRSGKAAAFFAQTGFTHIVNMEGGMMAWNDQNLPVHNDAAPRKRESTLGLGWLFGDQ